MKLNISSGGRRHYQPVSTSIPVRIELTDACRSKSAQDLRKEGSASGHRPLDYSSSFHGGYRSKREKVRLYRDYSNSSDLAGQQQQNLTFEETAISGFYRYNNNNNHPHHYRNHRASFYSHYPFDHPDPTAPTSACFSNDVLTSTSPARTTRNDSVNDIFITVPNQNVNDAISYMSACPAEDEADSRRNSLALLQQKPRRKRRKKKRTEKERRESRDSFIDYYQKRWSVFYNNAKPNAYPHAANISKNHHKRVKRKRKALKSINSSSKKSQLESTQTNSYGSYLNIKTTHKERGISTNRL